MPGNRDRSTGGPLLKTYGRISINRASFAGPWLSWESATLAGLQDRPFTHFHSSTKAPRWKPPPQERRPLHEHERGFAVGASIMTTTLTLSDLIDACDSTRSWDCVAG